MSNGIERRVWEHKAGYVDGFTKKYSIHRLVYCEDYESIEDANAREKQIKAWRREKTVALIESLQSWGATWRRVGTWRQRFLAALGMTFEIRMTLES